MRINIGKGMRQLAGLTATMLLAVGVVGTAGAQVVLTKHNLSASQDDGAGGTTNQGARNNYTTDTQQVCVFCHTPHGAATDKAPLWQRSVKDATFYKTYSSTAASTQSPTMDSDTNQPIGSVSVACLSCHDGTQAINTLANAPGSGGLNTTIGGWTAATASLDANKKIIGTWNLGGDGSVAGADAGADLRNDHPIGVAYSGGVTGAGKTTLTDTAFRAVKYTQINTKDVWYVDVDADNTRDKTDIQLFTRDPGTGNQPFVECSSCHDPHMNAKLFLRQTADGSKICLACHDK